LLAEADAHAFANLLDQLDGFDKAADEHSAAQRALIEYYLSPEHRDDPGEGCPTAGFAGDFAREETGPETHRAYEDGVPDFAGWLSAEDGDGLSRPRDPRSRRRSWTPHAPASSTPRTDPSPNTRQAGKN
jgi:TetR/AcrR family transcriptional repressor of nem operon